MMTRSGFRCEPRRRIFTVTMSGAGEDTYTVNSLRPFFRRFCNTRRPPGVLIRFKKPCVRFLFFFFG